MNLEYRKQISETDDRITIAEKIPEWGSISMILFGLFSLWVSYKLILYKLNSFNNEVIFIIILLAIGGYLSFFGTRSLLVKYSIIIDKKTERIIMKEDSIINFLKSIKEMPFSNLIRIEIERHKYIEEDFPKWSVNLIKTQGNPIEIYETDYKSDAEGLAEKISRVTKSEITRK